ncbi:MAG: GntR family transcriptional regulator [Calditrichaeota bacterium]|nr:GntR family transcriptional regulator [Calditrichota bacterium]
MGIDFQNPQPLYQQIANDIADKINRKKLKAGSKLGTQRELAQEYNVSLITIKKAISDLVQKGLLFARAGKGTFVAEKHDFADFSKHRIIGLVLRDLSSPFFSKIVQGVEKAASENGYNLLLSSSSNMKEKEENQIQHFLDLNVSGLVIASMAHIFKPTPIIKKLHQSHFPYVMVSYIEDENTYFVGTDHEKGGFMAAEHLIKLGYRRIGYINGEKGNLVGEKRRKGFLNALQEYGIAFDKKNEFRLRERREWNDYKSGYEIGEYFITLKEKPEAMFIYNDLSALGFERAVLDNGLKVPDDVAIVGYDDIKRGVVAAVPLTTIHQPTDEISKIAVETVVKQIEGKPVNLKTILEPKLIIRESCGAKRKNK